MLLLSPWILLVSQRYQPKPVSTLQTFDHTCTALVSAEVVLELVEEEQDVLQELSRHRISVYGLRDADDADALGFEVRFCNDALRSCTGEAVVGVDQNRIDSTV